MSDHDQPDVTARDALQVAQRALQKANRVDELDDVYEELTAIKLQLSELEDRPYRDRSIDEKVGMVRQHAYERARNGHGSASLDYDDIMWIDGFDGKPSADHCYKLMRLAADCRGFEYRESTRPKKLYVDAREAQKAVVFSSANKTAEEGAR